MNDVISRAAALAVVEKMYKMCEGNLSDYHDLLVACFTDLTSAQRWIPCKERMPKPKEYENDVLKYYLVQNEFGDMMVCSWDGKYWEQMYQYKNVRDKVVAWMPLPKPWKGEEK